MINMKMPESIKSGFIIVSSDTCNKAALVPIIRPYFRYFVESNLK